MKIFLCLLQALFFLISTFSVQDSKFKGEMDKMAVNLTSTSDFTFNEITAQEMKVSESEIKKCREWYDSNIRFAGTNGKAPAYDFTAGGKKLSKNLDDWSFSASAETAEGAVYKGGKTTYITVSSKKSALEATVEATIYEKNAACEWTVFIKNKGDKNSPVIKDFYGASMLLETDEPTLYFSKGSAPAADDFTLNKTDINFIPMVFTANGGRSASFLPFFNISGKNGGYAVAVGWTGQWYTSIEKKSDGAELIAKQQNFGTYLLPGEEIRSPLVSICFYDGDNALKGFNTLRNWEKDCVYPDSIETLNGYVIANEFSTKNTEELIYEVEKVNDKVLAETDYFWMDAGWYEYTEAWHDGVGNWIADPKRFPEGLKPLADSMTARNKKFLLWYEPERVRENTYLYNEAMKHQNWIVKRDNDLLWNLADDGACKFLSQYIAQSMVNNGVSVYRQDFNFSPLVYWEDADKNFYDGRKGICENHYVTNLYKYLDCLLDTVDGLIIDNCASGGKRLDIEMTRRSIPLWRSDYNCGAADGSIKEDVLEATQSMTYGLSFWLPYSGTNRYFHSEYASRSAILTNQSVYEPSPEEYNKYAEVSEYMTKNYYPVQFGGLELGKYHAMQFGDGTEGAAVIYKREKTESSQFTLKLNGLEPDKEYKITDIDKPGFSSLYTGKQLMESGMQLNITETPKAAVIFYKLSIGE